MKYSVSIISLVLLLMMLEGASAQQQQPVQLTDWRAVVDSDLSKVSMPRDAHAAIINLMQAYERQAQAARAQQTAPVDPK